MSLPLYIVDAFSNGPFTGNQAAVCILQQTMSDRWLQSVASEMNLAETAYLIKKDTGWSLRWFTPTVEVELCGHATIAAAHILWETGIEPAGSELAFLTLSGIMTAKTEGDYIILNFPCYAVIECEEPRGLSTALGVELTFVGHNGLGSVVEVRTEDELRALSPNIGLLEQVDTRGVVVTAKASTPGYDFVSRFFAPRLGVPEDPATGSAHCSLAPFWAERLGKTVMTGYQASKRGGVVGVQLLGDRVLLKGKACTMLTAVLPAKVVTAT